MGRDPINLLLTWTWSRQGTQGFCGGLLPKDTPPPSAACRWMWFRQAAGWEDGPASCQGRSGCMPASQVSHRKGKHVYPFLAASDYVAFSVSVIKI